MIRLYADGLASRRYARFTKEVIDAKLLSIWVVFYVGSARVTSRHWGLGPLWFPGYQATLFGCVRLFRNGRGADRHPAGPVHMNRDVFKLME